DRIKAGTLLIDVTVPLATAIGGRASRMLTPPAGSAAEQLAEYAPPGVQVMSAFHFLSAELLAGDGFPALDCDVLACGGDTAAQAMVRELAQAIAGTRYLHVGPLVASRLVEAAATMLIAINIRHKRHSAGMRVTGIM
ncbi:MAG: NADPH-dependent F420 reductase, partial [Chloroflexota bacterium]